MGQRDHGTAGRRDGETARRRDHETTGQRDHGTTGPRDRETTKKVRASPAISRSPEVPKSRKKAQSFSVVRGSAWQLGVRVVQMWCQVEVWLDGGVLGVHPHSDERAWCRRCAAITPREMRRYHAKLLGGRSRKMWCIAKESTTG